MRYGGQNVLARVYAKIGIGWTGWRSTKMSSGMKQLKGDWNEMSPQNSSTGKWMTRELEPISKVLISWSQRYSSVGSFWVLGHAKTTNWGLPSRAVRTKMGGDWSGSAEIFTPVGSFRMLGNVNNHHYYRWGLASSASSRKNEGGLEGIRRK